MKKHRLLSAALACTLLCPLAAAAQDSGNWRAASSTARSVTGDVFFAPYKIAINFSTFPLAQIRALRPAEASAVFSADPNVPGAGNLYRVDIPASKKFLHHNTLCASEDTEWVVTWVQGRTLQLALFSGSVIPTLTPDALNNNSALCNVFTYVR